MVSDPTVLIPNDRRGLGLDLFPHADVDGGDEDRHGQRRQELLKGSTLYA